MGKQNENAFRYLAQFWSEERRMTGFLIALIFDTLAVYPLISAVSSRVEIQIINILGILAVFLLGLFALTHHKITRMIFAGILIIAISARLSHFIFRANWLLGWGSLVSLLIIMAYLGFILRYVYKEGPVSRQRIEGAVAAYLLIIMAFALGYNLISFLIPGAIKFPDNSPSIDDPRFGHIFHYFSITTITTLGYGDIIPVHPVARTLTTLEALVGQLYPAILLARLVSLSIIDTQRHDKEKTIPRS